MLDYSKIGFAGPPPPHPPHRHQATPSHLRARRHSHGASDPGTTPGCSPAYRAGPTSSAPSMPPLRAGLGVAVLLLRPMMSWPKVTQDSVAPRLIRTPSYSSG